MALPAPEPVRNWDDFKRQAAKRMVAASPQGSYMGRVPSILFGIPIIEIELHADGSVRAMNVRRAPSDPAAANTVQYAMEAVRRAAPYADVSRLPKPWKWNEVFLFNESSQFKPRTLD